MAKTRDNPKDYHQIYVLVYLMETFLNNCEVKEKIGWLKQGVNDYYIGRAGERKFKNMNTAVICITVWKRLVIITS